MGDGKEYPRILDGKRACPLEDCGGTHGYEELVKIMKNKNHEEYEPMLAWLGNRYDPKIFRKSFVVFDNPKKRFKNAFGKHN